MSKEGEQSDHPSFCSFLLMMMKSLISVAYLSVVGLCNDFQEVMAFIDDVRCETATSDVCTYYCQESGACKTAQYDDYVWQTCREDIPSNCEWWPLVYFREAVTDTELFCHDLDGTSIMMRRTNEGPYDFKTPSGIM